MSRSVAGGHGQRHILFNLVPVPEPATLFLVGIGVATHLARARRPR
jgi:hypothetical protein